MSPHSQNGADAARVLDAVMAILQERTLDGVIVTALEAARALTGAAYAALGILADDGRTLSRFLTSGIDAETERAIGDRPRGRGVLGLLISEPTPLRLADIGAHPRSYGFPLNHPPMRTFLGVPLIHDGVPWGSLYLAEKARGEEFTDADESNLVALATATVRAAIHADEHQRTASRLVELERQAEALTASMEIARALGGNADVARITELIVKRARALTGARGAVLGVIDGDVVTRSGLAGELQNAAIGETAPMKDIGFFAELFRSGAPTHIARHSPEGELLAERFGADASLIAPLSLRGERLGVVVCVDRLERGPDFTDHDARLLGAFCVSAGVALGTARSAEARAVQRAIATSERERAHWARELHDQTLQELAAIKLVCGLANRTADAGERKQLLDQAAEQLEVAATDLRSLITDLRPASLDALGLLPALELLVERARGHCSATITSEFDLAFETGREPTRHTLELESVLYRVVQEALSNAVQHAAATTIDVRIVEDDATVVATVTDDGDGFETRDISVGFGLIGMRERAELVGGTLEVSSSPGAGSRITLTVPVARRPTEV